ncbi:hypothetical protein AB5J52_06775 [Streptomyces sp. R39]|uniref:DUF91 domain-containing protein n=1 Tax=Streptomyces sp. R39 TaxID=3238631 RepID=A0AB39QGV0_9ACTN
MRASIVIAGQTEVQHLTRVLRGLDVDDVWVLHNDLGDRYILDPVPDFVVGVLSDDDLSGGTSPKPFSNNDVALRVGLAAGRGVPALVIAPPPIQAASPDPLITVVACEVDAHQALTDHIWAFTTTLDLPSNPAPELPERRLKNPDHYLSELDRLDGRGGVTALQFERLVGQILMEAGAAVVEAESQGQADQRVDIAFMPSGGSQDIVLVELKSGRLTEKRLRDAEEQLQSFVIERRAKYGMVVYHDVEGRPLSSRRTTPLIFRMSARELIQRLAAEPLPKVLNDAVVEAVGRM